MSETNGLQIKLSAMSLIWFNPKGDQFIPWLKEVKAAGYDGISGFADWGWEEYIDHPEDFRAIVENEGLELASVDVKIHDNYEEYHRVCSFMQKLNCRHLVCIDRNIQHKDFGVHAARLNDIGEIARGYNVEAHYHNHTGGVGETFGDMVNLLNAIDPSKVSVMVDLGHATMDFVDLPLEKRAVTFLEKYIDQIRFLEFKDWNEQTQLNTPVGEGHCDYVEVFEILKAHSYSGWITVEQNGNDGLSLGRSPFECAKLSREYIRRGLGV